MGRISSWLAAVLLLACLALGYLYLRERAEMGLVRAEMAEKSANEQQSRRQIDDFRQKLAAANLAAKKAEEELTAQDSAATRAQKTASANRGGVINMNDIMRDHPEYAELQRKQLRRTLLRQYGDAFASLNLPPDQLAQLKDLLVGRSITSGDPRLAGLDPGTPAYNQAMRAARQAVSQQIDALIGPDGQRKLQDAQMLSSAQSQVANTYAPDFQEAGAPLSAEQSSSLAQLLNPRNNLARGPGANQVDPTTWLYPSDEALLEQAAQVLSPAQLAVLRSDRADQNHMSEIIRSYAQASGPAGTPTTIIMSGR